MALDPISLIKGRGVVISGDDIDTDRIIPGRYLRCLTFTGLGEALFRDVRYQQDGSLAGHPLDDLRFSGATVMVVSGANFGCGSSREHAPQSIHRAGFLAVIAESFAEIFFTNSTKIGLVCVTLSREEIHNIAERIQAEPHLELIVDISDRELYWGDKCFSIGLPESARTALVTGYWDPIGELLENIQSVKTTAIRLGYSSV
jgi:3-isopropylmalate/(R)-2-methylmalate dehydratase small subunit